VSGYNDKIIAEFRENGGTVTTGHGSGLLLLHSIGAKSGEKRINPVLGIVEGDGWLIAASKGGSPENPAWFHNLLAHPETEVEVPAGDHVDTVAVHAEVVPDADYPAAWARFVARSRGFADYAERTARRIPVVRLSRR
jgi:deazaflavin-dependent oxidoreductase (nitroreductase family)